MDNVVFRKSDIKTFELYELQGKTVEIVSVGECEGKLLMYMRNIENDDIYVVELAKYFRSNERRMKAVCEAKNNIFQDQKILDELRNEGFKKLKKKYGMYKGYSKVDLTKSFLTMSNDSFFKLYGFNYIPDMKLQDEVREILYGSESSKTTVTINTTRIKEDVADKLGQAFNEFVKYRMF